MKITVSNKSLRNAIVRTAKTFPLATINALAARQLSRSLYILKVLNAPSATQTAIKNTAAASSKGGTKSFAAVLTAFAALSAPNKAKFITAFKRNAAITVAGLRLIAARNCYSWGTGKRNAN